MSVKLLAASLRQLLPRNKAGDAVYAWIHYLVSQGRIPGPEDSGRLNDYFFHMKVDGTLLEPLRQFVSDKEYVKYYVSAVAGKQYTLETWDVLHSVRDIDGLRLSRFPCVVKPAHLSGQVQFCQESDAFLNREMMKGWLRKNLYRQYREQNYKYLSPRILVEEFYTSDGFSIPADYKFFCFGGSPKFIQVDYGRFSDHTRTLYDTNWKRLPFTLMYAASEQDEPPPAQLELMLDLAARLSAAFSFIRVDMYSNGRDVKVGELSNCPESAGGRIRPSSGEFALGKLALDADSMA